jgi:hypothetical protein
MLVKRTKEETVRFAKIGQKQIRVGFEQLERYTLEAKELV